MKITLKDIPKVSTNKFYEGTHWSKRKTIKDQILLLTKKKFKEIDFIDNKVDIHFTFNWQKNPLDSDNNSFLVKCLIDCLVKYGVLKNDTITYVGRVSMESVKEKTENYVEIELCKS